MDVHEKARERHKHYARHSKPLPDKLARAIATGSYRRFTGAEPDRIRDGHAAVLVRRSYLGLLK